MSFLDDLSGSTSSGGAGNTATATPTSSGGFMSDLLSNSPSDSSGPAPAPAPEPTNPVQSRFPEEEISAPTGDETTPLRNAIGPNGNVLGGAAGNIVNGIHDAFDQAVNSTSDFIGSLGTHVKTDNGQGLPFGNPVFDDKGQAVMEPNDDATGSISKGIAAGTALANMVFSPISGAWKEAEKVPVAGLPFKAVDWGLGAVSGAVKDSTSYLISKLPITNQAKQQLTGPIGDALALVSQVYAGDKVLDEVTPQISEHLALAKSIINNDILKTHAKPVVDETIQNVKEETPAPETTTQAKPTSFVEDLKNTTEPETTKTPLLVGRHGDIDKIGEDIAHGQTNDKLNSEGRQQAVQLGQQWDKQGVQHIVSSDLPRGKQTADIAAGVTGADVKTDPNLRTWDIGELDGKPKSEVDPQLEKYKATPDEKIPGGESYNEFKARVAQGIKDNQGENTAFVLHNEVLKTLGHEDFQPGESRSIENKPPEITKPNEISTTKNRSEAANKPVKTEGETTQSKSVAIEQITKNLDAAEAEKFKEDTSHEKMNNKEQAGKAWSFIHEFPDKADGIIFKGERPPAGLDEQSIFTARLQQAFNDFQAGKITFAELQKYQKADILLGTRSAQSLQLRAGRYDENHPSYYLAKADEALNPSGIEYAKEAKTRAEKETRIAQAKVSKIRLKVDEANKIIDMITC